MTNPSPQYSSPGAAFQADFDQWKASKPSESELPSLLESYKSWVDSDVLPSPDDIHEISDISFLREKIEYLLKSGNKHPDPDLLMADATFKEKVIEHPDEDFNDAFHQFRMDVPRSHWWFWLDKLDEHTPEGRSTL